MCPGSLRVLKSGSLGEDLNRILISSILMCQNEIYSLNFFHPWVWLAQMALIGFLLVISLSREIQATYPLEGGSIKHLLLSVLS